MAFLDILAHLLEAGGTGAGVYAQGKLAEQEQEDKNALVMEQLLSQVGSARSKAFSDRQSTLGTAAGKRAEALGRGGGLEAGGQAVQAGQTIPAGQTISPVSPSQAATSRREENLIDEARGILQQHPDQFPGIDPDDISPGRAQAIISQAPLRPNLREHRPPTPRQPKSIEERIQDAVSAAIARGEDPQEARRIAEEAFRPQGATGGGEEPEGTALQQAIRGVRSGQIPEEEIRERLAAGAISEEIAKILLNNLPR
jgi:hypothetical protein